MLFKFIHSSRLLKDHWLNDSSVEEDPKILAKKELSGGRTESYTGIKFARPVLLFRHAGDGALKKIFSILREETWESVYKLLLYRTHHHTQNINFKSFNANKLSNLLLHEEKTLPRYNAYTKEAKKGNEEEELNIKLSQKEVQ